MRDVNAIAGNSGKRYTGVLVGVKTSARVSQQARRIQHQKSLEEIFDEFRRTISANRRA
ncbi:hypothetical protein [Burkholderia sp. SRS-W-2-2016]|uniref:hypothetical protein n=1 Tax=Burkholderia sp. SRS-W-2-2016 TaxID=1926878 RepID=UPI000A7EA784|nr:hypothetical protein [Burkholderia sp. SRS-W-2-2016]